MAKSKTTKTTTIKASTDGKHRKETKDEKRARVKAEQEAREFCFKILPFILGAIVLGVVGFVMYVRSVPPKPFEIPTTNDGMTTNDSNGGIPPPKELFEEGDPSSDSPQLQETLKEAMEALDEAHKKEEEPNKEEVLEL